MNLGTLCCFKNGLRFFGGQCGDEFAKGFLAVKRAQEVCCQGVGVRNDPVAMKGSTFSSQGYSFFQRRVTTKVENRVYRDCLKFMRFGLVKWHWYLLSPSIIDLPLQLEAYKWNPATETPCLTNKKHSRFLSQPTPKKTWQINIFSLVEDVHRCFFFVTIFVFSALKGKHDLDQHFFQELKVRFHTWKRLVKFIWVLKIMKVVSRLAKHDTSPGRFMKSHLPHLKQNSRGASWKPRHASDQDMTRADELRRLRSDVRGSPEGRNC